MGDKWVYLFGELQGECFRKPEEWERIKGLLGGKGAGLAEMTRIGLPVPPGFTVTTEACKDFWRKGGGLADEIWDQISDALRAVERAMDREIGNPDKPLLVSCRSGAKFSMPGMMETILNIGMNDEVAEGMIAETGDARFVYNLYRRLVQMFGGVVMQIPDQVFESAIDQARKQRGATSDTDLTADDWRSLTHTFLEIYRHRTGHRFPADPYRQIKLATEAVFKSWNGKRAIDYRRATGIPDDLGTAVNIMTMVFGNAGPSSATGVALSRDGSTGKKGIEGDYLMGAQGEDVVAGIRQTLPIAELKKGMPAMYAELEKHTLNLEAHFRDLQDVEFTIENGKLWMLQTRNAKRTARAAVRIAVDMAGEGIITREEAVMRVTPEQVNFFLHPQFDPATIQKARMEGRLAASGLNVSPGAAAGVIALDADLAEQWGRKEGKPVILVRPETKPDDVHGMLAAKGIVTSRGGRTSHAALVARQFGKPAVVGASAIEIDLHAREITIGSQIIREGEWLSIDGGAGEIYMGRIDPTVQDVTDPWLIKLLEWADGIRRLDVRCNADYPKDAERARAYGATGIGLCRTEHMFFQTERLPYLREMILSDRPVERQKALQALLPFQRDDFKGLFKVMDGLPVIIRLIDPPLHEFLPGRCELIAELAALKMRLNHCIKMEEIDSLIAEIQEQTRILKRVEKISEQNPMLGLRGVRLGIQYPELTTMQVRAVFEAGCSMARQGVRVHPEIMIPLVCDANELKVQKELLEAEARKVMEEQEIRIDYRFGTMIELPRAALVADELAEYADFFSFGTNDLTQTTFGISRDDAESGFLIEYCVKGVLPDNPFATLDSKGVGELIRMAVTKARAKKPGIECGICGEHGGDPASIKMCHRLGLDYVSCSPFRIPVARLAAAHAVIEEKAGAGE